MPQALVTTKLHAPRTRQNLVARPRLREVLAAGEGHALTLVSAPAGFGKSTLLAEWLGERAAGGHSVAWLSLDEADNDPTRFLVYLVGALRTFEEGIGEGVLAPLRSPEPPPIEAVVGALINELAGVPRGITIVLDDYHLITSEPVHEAVSFLIEHIPQNARIVVSSRTDPPLPLPKLRARGQMAEVRAADLRFTKEEASAFLREVMGLTLSAGDVATLEEITEGWVAALQLAALSMKGHEDVSSFVEDFSGSNRYVLDFLAEEVLERQPARVREFLLKTSVLERMCAPLCDALTDRDDGQAMLERLERENLFVVPLDDERMWYRYHHLFAEFLRGRLRQEESELTSGLHLRASGWYERSGRIFEAVEHALAGGHYERAADLVERVTREMWSRGEVVTLLGWLRRLPGEAKHRRPKLFLDQATALVVIGRLDEIEAPLREGESAAAGLEEARRRHLFGYAAGVRSWRARLDGDPWQAIELARRSLDLMSEDDPGLRSFPAIGMGQAYRDAGELEAAGEAFAEAAELGRAAGHDYGALGGMVWRARVQLERGRLREAQAAFRQALRFINERGVGLLPAAGPAHLGMGALLYERNEIEGAERELERGIELAERTRDVSNLVWGYVTRSKVKMVRDEEEGSRESALEADRIARDAGAELEKAIAANRMARLRLACGEIDDAIAVEQERVEGGETVGAARAVDRMTSARVLHARGRHGEASRLLEDLGETAEEAGRAGELVEILALQALALWASAKKERAVGTLVRALALAEPEGYVRTFVDEGAAMAELLPEVLEVRLRDRLDAAGRVSVSYLARLTAALAQEDASAPVADERLPEHLSDRELEVLALIAAGNSNEEIAGKLFVSVTTVKTHINNLYRKLGAHSRTQAVARAREASLL